MRLEIWIRTEREYLIFPTTWLELRERAYELGMEHNVNIVSVHYPNGNWFMDKFTYANLYRKEKACIIPKTAKKGKSTK